MTPLTSEQRSALGDGDGDGDQQPQQAPPLEPGFAQSSIALTASRVREAIRCVHRTEN